MTKIARVIVFFILSVTIWNCKKKNPEPEVNNPGEWQFGEIDDRSGPGYSWRLTVEDQTNANGYIDMASNRLFYLDPGDQFAREVTLTVTKWGESQVNPSFRIYGRFQQCLLMSAPTLSSGGFTGSGLFERTGISGSAQYAGTIWTPALAKSPVNSKATFKFKVYTDSIDSLCTEGFIQADMTFPALITSEGSYGDGDYLYFIKKKS
ncbi:hypothetical protein [Dyadobacter sp. CY323]|uniref:hypothetical protein n=1 Tax=Dyadobacter sp. CY323 TaxID=2907302 RepID=UPI001F1A8D68|nr:hypothetical protein [Dyadobacter sp. CY323]MCE6991449.1 hypothetical protein [Dyadobacter sp. CY323]